MYVDSVDVMDHFQIACRQILQTAVQMIKAQLKLEKKAPTKKSEDTLAQKVFSSANCPSLSSI